MKHADLREGIKIKAVTDWEDCWNAGDEFIVRVDNGSGHAPVFYVECHHESGHHELDSMDDGDGDLPEFEPVAA